MIRPIATTLFILGGLAAQAAVYDTSVLPANYTGSRTITGGVTTGTGLNFSSSTTPSLNFTIAWEITSISGGFRYKYTLSGSTGAGLGVSHFLLDLSSNCTSNADGCIDNLYLRGAAAALSNLTYSDNLSGNPNLPVAIQGVRFPGNVNGGTQMSMTVEFDSPRVPVWGDFYLKLGQGNQNGTGGGAAIWNVGNLADSSNNILDFIARPDTQTVHNPEPATLLLVGGALVFVGTRRRMA